MKKYKGPHAAVLYNQHMQRIKMYGWLNNKYPGYKRRLRELDDSARRKFKNIGKKSKKIKRKPARRPRKPVDNSKPAQMFRQCDTKNDTILTTSEIKACLSKQKMSPVKY
jgi:hypothetical protein